MKTLYDIICEKILISKDTQRQIEKKRDDPSTWEVGDILAGCWGYSMTLPVFYEIIKRTDKSFTVVQRKGKIVSGHRNGQWEEIVDDSTRDKDLKGEKLTGRIRKWGGVKIGPAYVHLWNGEPLHGDDMD